VDESAAGGFFEYKSRLRCLSEVCNRRKKKKKNWMAGLTYIYPLYNIRNREWCMAPVNGLCEGALCDGRFLLFSLVGVLLFGVP